MKGEIIMIEIKDYYDIVLKNVRQQFGEVAELGESAIDIGDRFAFSVTAGGRAIMGAPLYSIDKHTKEIEYLILPDDDNFKLLESGTEIDISNILN